MQHKLAVILDVACVGSSSKDLLQQEQINAVPYGARFVPENQDKTRAPSSVPGAVALPDDLLRPYAGYANIRLLEYKAYSNYHALQASLNRRFDDGLMFSAFCVWSKALGIASDDFTLVRPNASDAESRRADYSHLSYDRPHNFVVNLVYQTPRVASGVLGVLANDWQISGAYRWTSGRPYAIGFSIPGIGSANLTGSDVNQNARVVLTCDPGKGWSGDPYRQLDTSCFAPPQPGSDGTESARYFLHAPPIDNLDLSLSKAFVLGKGVRLEVRLDAFNALNHTQFTGVNSTVSFASLSDRIVTNLPYDGSGNLVRTNGFGSINGVAPPRTLQLVTRLTFQAGRARHRARWTGGSWAHGPSPAGRSPRGVVGASGGILAMMATPATLHRYSFADYLALEEALVASWLGGRWGREVGATSVGLRAGCLWTERSTSPAPIPTRMSGHSTSNRAHCGQRIQSRLCRSRTVPRPMSP